MNGHRQNEYFENRILTASPAQLHLMLIEGAIRFARQADKDLEQNEETAAAVPLLRAMDIVSEMLAGVRHSEDEVNVKLAELYRFIFTRLTQAYVNTDRAMLAEALQLLDFERETWQLACERVRVDSTQEKAPRLAPPAPPSTRIAPLRESSLPEGGLSIEA